MPVTIEDVRRVAEQLPRSYEVLVRDRVKFRVGKIVWLAFSADETQMGFAFPKEERDVLVASEPDVFLMPRPSDLRFNWVEVRLDAIDVAAHARDRHRRLAPRRPQERGPGAGRRLSGARRTTSCVQGVGSGPRQLHTRPRVTW